MRKNKKYDAELKINCIREVLVKHRSQREVARECDIAPWNIRSWIRKYEEYGGDEIRSPGFKFSWFSFCKTRFA